MGIDYSSSTAARKRFPDFLSRIRRLAQLVTCPNRRRPGSPARAPAVANHPARVRPTRHRHVTTLRRQEISTVSPPAPA